MATIRFNSNALPQDWQEVVRRQVSALNFGSIEIVIHDSRIVEIDTTERLRFPNGGLKKVVPSQALNDGFRGISS